MSKKYETNTTAVRPLFMVDMNHSLELVKNGCKNCNLPFNRPTIHFYFLSEIDAFISWCWNNNQMNTCKAASNFKFDLMLACIWAEWDINEFIPRYEQAREKFLQSPKSITGIIQQSKN